MALARVQYIQQIAGNKNFKVPFPYISRDHVRVTVDGAVVSYDWLSPSTIAIQNAPAKGALVEVRRVTERDRLLVDFQDASTITEEQLDLLAQQNFYLSQEADDLAQESNTLAYQAEAIADAAETKADFAVDQAGQAVSTANSASSTASQARVTADGATATANEAKNIANTATATAESAVRTADAATASASDAVSIANRAASQSRDAERSASSAVNIANAAEDKANTAMSVANTARSTADTALSNSEVAVQLADAASIRSDVAQDAAVRAQAAAESAAGDAQTAVRTASQLEETVLEVLDNVEAIAGGDLSDLAKNSENLSELTDKEAARENLGLGKVDNTSDLDKPLSTAMQEALASKAAERHTHRVEDIEDLKLDWDSVTDKPSVFPPAPHQHRMEDITDLSLHWNSIEGKPSTYSPSAHSHGLGDLPPILKGLATYSDGLIDPDTTTESLILSQHPNAPGGGFWFIRTLFYSSISADSNRVQLALAYADGKVFVRNYNNGSWTPWHRVDGTGWTDIRNRPTTFPPSSHTHSAADIAPAFYATGLHQLVPNGYQRIPGGMIIQFGYRSISQWVGGWSSVGSITFPVAFPTEIIGWTASWEHENDRQYGVTFQATNLTRTGTGTIRASDTGMDGNISGKLWYIAIGY